MTTRTRPQPIVLSAEAVEELTLEPLGPHPGVTHRVLWRDGTSMAGVLVVEGGRSLGRHSHRTHHHHAWVVEGRALILGEELGPGSYVHIPSGVEHDIDASSTAGCTVFYLYAAPSA